MRKEYSPGKIPFWVLSSRHYQVATSVLEEVNRLAINYNLTLLEDDAPFHTVVKLPNSEIFSVWCGGFDSHLEVCRLLESGEADPDFKEEGFSNPNEVITFLTRRS